MSDNILYENEPVNLAEVVDASEASLRGPGGRAWKMHVNRVKEVVIMVFDGFRSCNLSTVMY